MYRIGIIDDVKSERADIQVSILDNVNQPEDIEFKEYVIEKKSRDALLGEIREDIISNRITGLIVDFKLDTTEVVIRGAEIISFMHDETPEFPVVIMTNAPDDSKEAEETDADKVYAKKIFMNPERPETREMVQNILINMRKYSKSRHDLEGQLEIQISKLNCDKSNETVIQKIIEIEEQLSKYKQMFLTSYVDKVDIKELRDAADLLRDFKNILGE